MLDDTVHLANSDGGTHTERHTYLGDCNIACAALRDLHAMCVGRSQDLPNRHLYARCEAYPTRLVEVAEVLAKRAQQESRKRINGKLMMKNFQFFVYLFNFVAYCAPIGATLHENNKTKNDIDL